jgi:hypothetical protein
MTRSISCFIALLVLSTGSLAAPPKPTESE